jgi:basic amino acid/polyamine antiporter, APA family
MKKQTLNRFDFTMIMVTLVIGMGIFRTPTIVAAQSHNAFIFFGVWIFGGLVAICGALTYAEIGSRYPVTGGYYKIFSYAYHPSIAFAINCIILISNAASLAGVALIGAEYIIKVVMPNATNTGNIQIVIGIVAILIFYGINLAGLKMSARAQNFLAIVKIGLIILLITPIFFYTNNNAIPAHVSIITHPTMLEYIKAFGAGLVAVSFTYGGYQQSINFGEEVKNPSKNIPFGIIYGLLIIIILYLGINYAYYKIIGFETLKTSKNIAAILAGHVFGTKAGNVLSVLLFMGVLAYVNALLMSNPRVMEAMGEEGTLPKVFAERTKNNNVLFYSLSIFTAITILIIFWAKTFDSILSFTMFLDSIGMVFSAATIFKLRKNTAHLNHTGIFQMKWYPVLPIFFMLIYTFVAVIIFVKDPPIGFTGIKILFAFIALYFIAKPPPFVLKYLKLIKDFIRSLFSL